MTNTHRVFLAGTNFGQRSAILGDIPEHAELILKREPENKYDSNATSVWISTDELKKHGLSVDDELGDATEVKLGMMPASRGPNWAMILAPLLDAKVPVAAKFRRHQDKQIRIVIEGDALPECVA